MAEADQKTPVEQKTVKKSIFSLTLDGHKFTAIDYAALAAAFGGAVALTKYVDKRYFTLVLVGVMFDNVNEHFNKLTSKFVKKVIPQGIFSRTLNYVGGVAILAWGMIPILESVIDQPIFANMSRWGMCAALTAPLVADMVTDVTVTYP